MLRKINYVILSSLLLASPTYAADISLGGLADGITGPIAVATKILMVLCYIVGAGLLMAAFVRFNEYRRNPLAVRVSTPIFLGLFGVLLIALPLISKFSSATTAIGGQQLIINADGHVTKKQSQNKQEKTNHKNERKNNDGVTEQYLQRHREYQELLRQHQPGN